MQGHGWYSPTTQFRMKGFDDGLGLGVSIVTTARRISLIGTVLGVSCVLLLSAPAAGAKTTLPDACKLVTQGDIQTAYAKLEPALVPTSVGTPTRSKPRNQGGFGPQSCETVLQFPNSVGGSVLVSSLKASKFCPAPGQPGNSGSCLRLPRPRQGRAQSHVAVAEAAAHRCGCVR